MTAAPIKKIDAHHHLWTLDAARYPMLSGPPVEHYFGNTGGLRHPFAPQDFAALAAPENVVKSICVEAMYAPPAEETAVVQAWSDRCGGPNAFIARADLRSPEIGAVLDAHMRHAGFRGVRTILNWDEDPRLRSVAADGALRDPAWRAGYADLGRRDLIAEVMLLPFQLRDLVALAEAEPGTRLVLNHAGMPLARTPQEVQAWRGGMRALAALDHVAVKISGLGMIDHGWTTRSIRPVVEETIDIFGPARCLFASNFPIDGLHASYAAVWRAFEDITATRPAAERAALFHDNAERLYRLA